MTSVELPVIVEQVQAANRAAQLRKQKEQRVISSGVNPLAPLTFFVAMP